MNLIRWFPKRSKRWTLTDIIIVSLGLMASGAFAVAGVLYFLHELNERMGH